MGMTVSMSVGRVAIAHDIRKEISANVDVNLMHQNEIFIDRLQEFNYDVEAYTNAKFQPVLDEYNAKQSRPERRKEKPYTEYIREENEKLIRKATENKEKGINKSVRKPTKLVHEYVLQFGNRDDNGTTRGADIELNRRMAKETLDRFQKKFPHAEVLLATFHADEPQGTPHLHVLVQFVGEHYKNGLKRQISMSRALENDGFERSQNRGDYAVNRWCKNVQDEIMEPVLQEYMEIDREKLDEHREHDDIRIFREKAKAEAKALQELHADLEPQIAEKQEILQAQETALTHVQQSLEEAERNLSYAMNDYEVIKNEYEDYFDEKEALVSQTEALRDEQTVLAMQNLRLRRENTALERLVSRFKAEFTKFIEILQEYNKSLSLTPTDREKRMENYMRTLTFSDGRTAYDGFVETQLTFKEKAEEAKRQADEMRKSMSEWKQMLGRGSSSPSGGSRTKSLQNENENDNVLE